MSCRLIPRSKICEIKKIRAFLNRKRDADGREVENDNNSDDKNTSSWLSTFIIAISPAEDLLVIAKDNKALFLTRKPIRQTDNDTSQWIDTCWKSALSSDEQACVTSLLCIPLASQQRSSHGAPDWSCIIAGFNSGFIRIYMQNGELLLSQFLHDSPVVSLNLRTKLVSDSSDQIEELAILYLKAIVVIDGFSLYQSLRACRSQLAKAHASNFQENILPTSLAYRKWKLDGQEEIFDIVDCGMAGPCTFDSLVESSSKADSKLKSRLSTSGSRKIISSGKNPFIGWYELIEESSTPFISEVALTVASKLTTAVFSRISSATGDWLGFGSKSSPQRKDVLNRNVEPGTNARLRYGLPDKRRRAESIVLSPNDSLAACTDDFGRILLISSQTGLVVRMFKGYRDAQCGWLLSEEEPQTEGQQGGEATFTRQALFLVIYAPRRGILEIWLAEQGSRVSAFTVGKDCRLIYNRFGVLGNSGKYRKDMLKDLQYCFLLENNGNVTSINVPFHCALSLSHSVKMRDGYLLKKMASILDKSTNFAFDAVQRIKSVTLVFQEIDVPDYQFRAILQVISHAKLSAEAMENCLLAISNIFSDRVEEMGAGGDVEYKSETETLINFCMKQLELIRLYRSIIDLYSFGSGSSSGAMDLEENYQEHNINSLLMLNEEETIVIQSTLDKFKDTIAKDQTGGANDLPVSLFLKPFQSPSTEPGSEFDLKRISEISSIDISDQPTLLKRIASFIFKRIFTTKKCIKELAFLFNSSHLCPETLMVLLATFILEDSGVSFDVSTMFYLHGLVSTICSYKVKSSVGERISLLKWWNPIRDVIEHSYHLPQSILMAFICQCIPASHTDISSSSTNDEDIWQGFEINNEEWRRCVNRLVDLVALEDFLLSDQFNLTGTTAAEKSCAKLSIQDILTSEQGLITQIVASHLIRRRVPGPCIKNLQISKNEEDICEDAMLSDNNGHSEILEAIRTLQYRFPNSLETNILLAHCCWECIISWKNDIEDISNLFSAVVHLSSISNAILKQGLSSMFWKAVYKDTIKNIYNLVEKVGKCPKDRLCRKHTGMSNGAVVKYLLSAQNLLELLFELDFTNAEAITIKNEFLWQTKQRSGSSIVDNAMDTPICHIDCIKAMWSIIVTLRLIILTGMKSKRPSEYFDSKNALTMMQSFPIGVAVHEVNDSMTVARRQFCSSALSLLVAKYSTSDQDEDTEDSLMTVANHVFQLSKYFDLEEDILWQHFTCQLFLYGFDSVGYEATLSVHNKDALVKPLLTCVGSRLAGLLIESADSATLSTVLTSFPTHITSWLQSLIGEKAKTTNGTVSKNIYLLNRILALTEENSVSSKFIADLIESLELLSVP